VDNVNASDSEKLARANADHDENPSAAAELLRQIDPANLSEAEVPTFIFLLNHVLGEKLSAWDDALKRHQRVLDLPGTKPGWWRQAGAAALAAGNDEALGPLVAQYAKSCQADAARAREVIQLSAAVHQVPMLAAPDAARMTSNALAMLEAPFWRTASSLDAAVATCLNNIAGGIKDRPASDLANASLRTAVSRCAELAEEFWRRAGTWVNVERALYLRATVATALRDFEAARCHCLDALAVLDANDSKNEQPVDRAFVELERAHACEQLGEQEEREAAFARSAQLAASFNDPGLQKWFESRRALLAADKRA
jgi:hypothetical protein